MERGRCEYFGATGVWCVSQNGEKWAESKDWGQMFKDSIGHAKESALYPMARVYKLGPSSRIPVQFEKYKVL